MGDIHQLIIKRPEDCDAAEKAAFVEMAERGGEVTNAGLPGRVSRGEWLAFLYVNGQLVGSAGLKHPDVSYREKLINKSKVDLSGERHPLELGWIFVVREAEENGFSELMSRALIRLVRGTQLFATTRTNNDAMNRVLAKLAFRGVGELYKSDDKQSDIRVHTLTNEAV